MVINLLKNQPKQFQMDLSFDIKSNLNDSANSLAFSETLKTQPKNNIATSNLDKNQNESYVSRKVEEKINSEEKVKETFSDNSKRNIDEKKEQNVEKHSKTDKLEDSPKKDEKVVKNLEEEKITKKEKKVKINELVFLDILSGEKNQLLSSKKENLEKNSDNLKENIILENFKKFNLNENLKLGEENSNQEEKVDFKVAIKKQGKTSNELLESLIVKEDINPEDNLETIKKAKVNLSNFIKSENETDKLKEFTLNEDKRNLLKEEKIVDKNELNQEKSKNLSVNFLRENIETKNEKIDNKNIKVAQNAEVSNTENLENLSQFKDSNQKQENSSSQQQKDFSFNLEQKLNSKISQSDASKESASKQSFVAKDLKSNFKDLVQSAKINIIGKGQTSAEIQMNPKELGKMSLKISMMENQIKGVITVDSEVVKNILSMEMNSLKQDLKDAGFSLDFLNIDLANEKEKNNQFAKLFQEEMNNSLKENSNLEDNILEAEEIERNELVESFVSKKIDIKA